MGGLKGDKTLSLANFTSTQIQTDKLHANHMHLQNDITLNDNLKLVEEVRKLMQTVKDLELKLKEVEDKVNSFETAE